MKDDLTSQAKNGVNVIIRPTIVQEIVCCLELDEVYNKLQGRFVWSLLFENITLSKNLE